HNVCSLRPPAVKPIEALHECFWWRKFHSAVARQGCHATHVIDVAVSSRGYGNPIGAAAARIFIRPQRRVDVPARIRKMRGKRYGIFEGHHRTLGEKWKHGMGRIADECRAAV